MKRIPFIISIILLVVGLIIIGPILATVWLLGGNNPSENMLDAVDKILVDGDSLYNKGKE